MNQVEIPTLTDSHSVCNEQDVDSKLNGPGAAAKNKILINYHIRPESPFTQEIMRELGLTINDIKLKTKEDFKTEGISPELLDWRYKQHHAKITKNIKEFLKVKKIKSQRNSMDISNHGHKYSASSSDLRSPIHSKLGGTFLSSLDSHLESKSHKALTLGFSPGNTTIMSQTMPAGFSTYQKALRYVRNSHNTAEIKNIEDLRLSRDGTGASNSLIESEITKQIIGFNQIKQKKQKELKELYEMELKRLALLSELKNREEKSLNREKKLKQEQMKKIKEKNTRHEEKVQKLKQLEDNNFRKQMSLETKMKKKFEQNRKKFEEEQEQKRQVLMITELKNQRKRQDVIHRRALKEQAIEAEMQEIKFRINEKLAGSRAKYEHNKFEKLSSIRSELIRTDENARKVKEKVEEEHMYHVHTILEKMQKKEDNIKKWKKELQQNSIAKKKIIEEKEKKVIENYKGENQNQLIKTRSLEERLKKVEENVAHLKEQEEKNIRLKQEMRTIKMIEQKEAQEINRRKLEYEQQRIIQKEKMDLEKINLSKTQKEFILKTRHEIAIQSKIEIDRISQSRLGLGKLLLGYDNPQAHLSSVLPDDDLKDLKEKKFRGIQTEIKNQKEVSNGNESQKSQ